MNPLRRLLLAALAGAALSGCSDFRFRTYEHPHGLYTLEAPVGWNVFTNIGTASSKPIEFVLFGSDTIEGRPWVAVYRIPKLRNEFPGSDLAFRQYQLIELRAAADVFQSTSTAVSKGFVSGLPARSYRGDWKHKVPTAEEGKSYLATDVIEQTVIDRPDAYFVIEFKVGAPLHPRMRPVYENALMTFRLSKG